MTRQAITIALFVVAAALSVAGPIWSNMTVAAREAETHQLARAMLDDVVTRDASGTRLQASCGMSQLTNAQLTRSVSPEDEFQVTCVPTTNGAVQVSVDSRPEAVREGRLSPLRLQVVVPGHGLGLTR